MKILRIDEFASSVNIGDGKYYVYRNNSKYYGPVAQYLVTSVQLPWDDVELLSEFGTFREAFEYADSLRDKQKHENAVYSYELVDELVKIIGKKVEKMFDYGYYVFDPYHKGFEYSSERKPLVATTYRDYIGMVNDLHEYGGKKRIFYFDGKPFTGKADYVKGYNGYTFSKDNGLLCALIGGGGLWTDGKPNALVDNNGKTICYPYSTDTEGGYSLYFKNGEFIGNHPYNGNEDTDLAERLEGIVNSNKMWVDMGGGVLWKNKNEKESIYAIDEDRIRRRSNSIPTKEDYEELLDSCELVIGTCNGENGVYVHNKSTDSAIFFSVDSSYKYAIYPTSTEWRYDKFYSFMVQGGSADIDVYKLDRTTRLRLVKRK